jgi:hypothetical protein
MVGQTLTLTAASKHRAALSLTLTIALFCSSSLGVHARAGLAQAQPASPTKAQFDVIEGVFHDGLGTYAEIILANQLISVAGINQPLFDPSQAKQKMENAIGRLPGSHPAVARFRREIGNIEAAVKNGATQLIAESGGVKLIRVRHTAREYSGARAGDLSLEFSSQSRLPISVKTDKSGKVAVTEGQTPEIGPKWAERYFRVSPEELARMVRELGFGSESELRSDFMNVARLVSLTLIRKLKIENAEPKDFSRARCTDLEAAKHLFRQLLRFKKGSDGSRVIIFDRVTGLVRWEALLDSIDIESLTLDRISFLPSRPKRTRPIASEFGVKVDGRTVVTFQIKHKRGRFRDTARRNEFSDITTRLRL